MGNPSNRGVFNIMATVGLILIYFDFCFDLFQFLSAIIVVIGISLDKMLFDVMCCDIHFEIVIAILKQERDNVR